ncbi:MAG: ATP-binding protein [Gammaproteobacteria bacterium]|nr:ATP-binding protein [Gammaproteobacteria bacterium]
MAKKQQRSYQPQAIEALFQYEPFVFIVFPILAWLITLGLWQAVDHSTLLIWSTSISSLVLVRYVLYHKYKTRPNDLHISRWAWYYTVITLLYGLAWGIAGVLFINLNHPNATLFWFTVMMGNYIWIIPISGYWLPSYYAYVLPGGLAVPVYLLSQETYEYNVLGLLALLFIVICFYVTHLFQRFFISNIRLRFQNVSLVKKLQREKESAEQANRAKSLFLAAASHDLRQPLHAVGLYAELLQQKLKEPEQFELLKKLNNSNTALNGLLNSLLDISRLEAGSLQPELKTISSQQLMQQLQEEFSPQFKQQHRQLRFHSNDLKIVSDPTLLARILRNFISNALQYGQQGKVLVSCRKRENSALFQVWDQGAGIAKEQHFEIFDEFTQLKNAQRDRSQGLGLGLAIVKRLSRLLTHPINLSSQLERGSVFSVSVPSHQQNMKSVSMATAPTVVDTQMDLIVLLIDNDHDILDATSQLISSWGCQVIQASNYEHAKTQLNSDHLRPQVIISDFRLGKKLTGINVIQNIRQRLDKRLPALLITGDTSPETLRELRDSQLPVLHKPLQPMRLRAFLHKINIE